MYVRKGLTAWALKAILRFMSQAQVAPLQEPSLRELPEKPLQLFLPGQVHRDLKVKAARLGLPMSEVVHRLILNFLHEK